MCIQRIYSKTIDKLKILKLNTKPTTGFAGSHAMTLDHSGFSNRPREKLLFYNDNFFFLYDLQSETCVFVDIYPL